MRFECKRTLSRAKITRQPKNHLNKIRVGNRAYTFGLYIEDLTITVDQIDGDGRSSFPSEQLEVFDEDNQPGILATREIKEVCTNNRKRISEQSHRVQTRELIDCWSRRIE